MPTIADYFPAAGVLAVSFSGPIANQPTALTNWVLAPTMVNPTNATIILPDIILLTFAVGLSPTTLSYLASPPDVVGTNGLDVEPFTMPVT